MTDIAPEMLAAIREVFANKQATDKTLAPLVNKIQLGTATYRDVNQYAIRLGELLSESMRRQISADNLPDGRMYYNIAETILGPLLSDNQARIADAAMAAQNAMNKAAGIGLKAVRPELSTSRVEGLIEKVSSYEDFADAAWVLDEPVVNFSQSVVDDAIRENVEYQGRAGLSPRVKRIATGGCCKWCASLAGVYEYPIDDDDVYRRHERCRCTVLYDPGNGKVQDAHTKIAYNSRAQAERDSRIDQIKALEAKQRQTQFLSSISNRPELLSKYEPQQLKDDLLLLGFRVEPLSNGKLKGVPLERGGGFKVTLADGGQFMYHPAEKSHYGTEYFKLSTAEGGTRRYDSAGDEIRTDFQSEQQSRRSL